MKGINRAFTIMEVMISLVVISIIAAFALPQYGNAIRKAHEKDAISQLIAIYASNEVYKAQTNEFLPTGTGNIAAINAGLGINVIANDMVYVYNRSAADAYTATATWNENATLVYTVLIDEAAVDGTTNPCCSAGSCPTLPAC